MLDNKEQRKIYMREWRKKNPEKSRANNANSKKRHPEKVAEGKRLWTKNNPESIKRSSAKYYQKNKEKIKQATSNFRESPQGIVYAIEYRKANQHKIKARGMIAQAIKHGGLERLPCVCCGDEKSEAHHKDYLKPMDVIWLCSLHHKRHHAENSDADLLFVSNGL